MRILDEFAIERDGGPVIVPVSVEWPSDTVRAEKRPTICRMLLDTGSTGTLFDVAHRPKFGRPTGMADMSSIDPDRSTKVETFKAPVMHIGTLDVRGDREIICYDLSHMSDAFREKIDGILGMDVLCRLAFSMDFGEGTLRFHRAIDATFGRRVPLFWSNEERGPGCPMVRAVLDDGEAIEFLVDTGHVETFSGMLERRAYDRLSKEASLVPAFAGCTDQSFKVGGIDASIDVKLGRARGLSFGGYRHQGLIFARFGHSALSLGYLSRFSVAFDFPNSAMYLRPGRGFGQLDGYDLSDLDASRSGGTIVINEVYAGGAAAAAGIHKGDIIMAIDGTSTREMSLWAFLRILCTDGRRTLEISRDGAQRQVILALDKALHDPFDHAAEATERWALLVGVDRYLHAKDLGYYGNDQRALAAQLLDNGFERVVLLHEQADDSEHFPCKANIEQQLELLC